MPINGLAITKKKPLLFLVRLHGEETIGEPLFSKEEIKAIRYYKKKEDQLLKATSFLLVSSLIKKPILFNKFGKPFVKAGPYFSLSHSYPYVALVLSSHPIGLDIETNKVWDSQMNSSCFSKEEMNYELSPLRLWTLKEALYKSKGDYPFEPKNEKINILNEKTLQDDNSIKFYLFLGDNDKELTIVSDTGLDQLETSYLTYSKLSKQRRTNYGIR